MPIHHHRPVFSGDLSAEILNNESTVSGRALIEVRNQRGRRDSFFRVRSAPIQTALIEGEYGTAVLDKYGNWTYTLNAEHPVVSNLDPDETVTDSLWLVPVYIHRNSREPILTITIRGAGGGE